MRVCVWVVDVQRDRTPFLPGAYVCVCVCVRVCVCVCVAARLCSSCGPCAPCPVACALCCSVSMCLIPEASHFVAWDMGLRRYRRVYAEGT